jgi:hypothetical protein
LSNKSIIIIKAVYFYPFYINGESIMPNELSLTKLNELLDQSKARAARGAGKNLVLVIGNTSHGKSTCINMLAGRQVEPKQVNKISVLEAQNPIVSIGHSLSVSETLFSEIVDIPDADFSICDTPGFEDTGRSYTEKLCAGRGVQFAIEHAGAIRAIIAVVSADSFDGRSEPFRKFIKNFISVIGSPTNLGSLKQRLKFLITKLHVNKEDPNEPRAEFLAKINTLKEELEKEKLKQIEDSAEDKALAQEIAILELIDEGKSVFFFSKNASGFIPGSDEPVEQSKLKLALISAIPKEGEIPKEALAIYSEKRSPFARDIIIGAAKVQLQVLIDTLEASKAEIPAPAFTTITAKLLSQLLATSSYYYRTIVDEKAEKKHDLIDPIPSLQATITEFAQNKFSTVNQAIDINNLLQFYLKFAEIIKDLCGGLTEYNKINNLLKPLKDKIAQLNEKLTEHLSKQINIIQSHIKAASEQVRRRVVTLDQTTLQLQTELTALKTQHNSDIIERKQGLVSKTATALQTETEVKRRKLERLEQELREFVPKPTEPIAPKLTNKPIHTHGARPAVPEENYTATGGLSGIGGAIGDIGKHGSDITNHAIKLGTSAKAANTAASVSTGAGTSAASAGAAAAETGGTVLSTAGKAAAGAGIVGAGAAILGTGVGLIFDKLDQNHTKKKRENYIKEKKAELKKWEEDEKEYQKAVNKWQQEENDYKAAREKYEGWKQKNVEMHALQDEVYLLGKRLEGEKVSEDEAKKALEGFAGLYQIEEEKKAAEILAVTNQKEQYLALQNLLEDLPQPNLEQISHTVIAEPLQAKYAQLQPYSALIQPDNPELLGNLHRVMTLIELEAQELGRFSGKTLVTATLHISESVHQAVAYNESDHYDALIVDGTLSPRDILSRMTTRAPMAQSNEQFQVPGVTLFGQRSAASATTVSATPIKTPSPATAD